MASEIASLATERPSATEAAHAWGVATAPARRPPPQSICILVPVWGADFISKFLEQSLPTLLAPGNIPGLARALPTRFVFLTRAPDEGIFRAHPACERLQHVCAVEFLAIDDLITRSNHSTTITLAYARAVRQAGESMRDTCFFFLVSDYIIADGSLVAVLARMQKGASAVQAGNFQLDEGAAEDWLLERLAQSEISLSLNPREVMSWALSCLHPLTAANIINYPLCHNDHINRLLWHVDSRTLIGRFYLLHMICIRPEIADFVISSSCDYSFVPEMCPSGNVETVTDSDEYLVVEVQPASHEANFLRLGPMPFEALARHLSEWTTAGHRANATQTIVFHAGPLPERLPAALAEIDAFMAKLTPLLTTTPQPHRNHPYWLGAIAAFEAAVAGRDMGTAASILRIVRRIQRRLFGEAPDVTRLHPQWKDYRTPLSAFKGLSIGTSRLLIGASRATPLSERLLTAAPNSVRLSLLRLVRLRPEKLVELGLFDIAFCELLDNEIANSDLILRHIAPLMRPGGQIVVFALNQNWFGDPTTFAKVFAQSLSSLTSLQLWPEEFYIAASSRMRWRINNATIAAAIKLYQQRTIFLPLHLATVIVLCPLMAIANFVSSWRANRFTQKCIASSIFIRLRAAASDDKSQAGGSYGR